MKIAILTSGGDAPGMNAAIHSLVKVGIARGHETCGIERGYQGLMNGLIRPLKLTDVDGISRWGGTMLGSSRAPKFTTDLGRRRAAEILAQEGIEGLVVIGGNGSLTGAHLLAPIASCPIVGMPASIDNDIGHCGMAIGVDTAVNTIVEACDRISDTARAHRRAFVVEVMGRQCGFLAMRAGLAAEADAIIYRENSRSEEEVFRALREMLSRSFSPARDKKRVLVIKSEGVEIATSAICETLRQHALDEGLDVDVRETVLGHLVRGGSPSAADRVIAGRLAYASIGALEAGMTDCMISWEPPLSAGEATADPRVGLVPLADMITETKALLSGTSPTTEWRQSLLGRVEELLAI